MASLNIDGLIIKAKEFHNITWQTNTYIYLNMKREEHVRSRAQEMLRSFLLSFFFPFSFPFALMCREDRQVSWICTYIHEHYRVPRFNTHTCHLTAVRNGFCYSTAHVWFRSNVCDLSGIESSGIRSGKGRLI